MKIKRNYFKNVFRMMALVMGFVVFNCNAYDLLGKINAGAPKKQLKVFVSSATLFFPAGAITISPNISACSAMTGIGLGNCVCNALASSAGLQAAGAQSFHAWMSDSVATDAACNILGSSGRLPGCNGKNSPANGTFVDKTGKTLFNSWSDILNGVPPQNTISIMENSLPYSGNVWTGTSNGGVYAVGALNTNSCSDWTAGGGSGIVGSTTVATIWSNTGSPGTVSCTSPEPIYCFEQP